MSDGLADNLERLAARGAADDESKQLALQAVAALPGGPNGVVAKLMDAGLGEQVGQWQAGTRVPVSPTQIHDALGEQSVQAVAQRMGAPKNQLLRALAQNLP